MTKKEFVELLIDDRDGYIHRRVPGGKKLSFIAKPKKARHLTITPEYETFWTEVRSWLEGGAYPEGLSFDIFNSFQDELESGLEEAGEVHDLAFKILKEISGAKEFSVLYIPIKELQAMGWTFDQYLAASIREDMPKLFTTISDRFAQDAVETWPTETETWTAETLKDPQVDSGDSPYVRAIRSAMTFLIRDAKKYAHLQDQVDSYVREIYSGNSDSRRHIVMNFCHRYRAASTEIHKIIRDIMEKQETDLIYRGDWSGICDDLKLPDYTYPVLIAKDIAWTPEIEKNKYVPETEYFKDLLKNNRDRFMHSYEKLLEEKEPFALRLIKILHIADDAASDAAVTEKLAALNAAPGPEAAVEVEAFWQHLETAFVKDRIPRCLESLSAACGIIPRAQVLYASMLDTDRQLKKKKENSCFNRLVTCYFIGREESRYGEKSNVILDELISNKLISAEEFFTVYNEEKSGRYALSGEILDYAFAHYTTDAEAFTAKAGKLLEADEYLSWLDVAGTRRRPLTSVTGKLRPLTFVPVLAASSKRAVDLAEQYILAADPTDRDAIIEAVTALVPKLKKNGASAAARILAVFKAW